MAGTRADRLGVALRALAGADDAAGELDLQPGLARGSGDALQRGAGMVGELVDRDGEVDVAEPDPLVLGQRQRRLR
jgi:hypothetical protein